MPDADVAILHGIELPFASDIVLQRLTAEIAWRQQPVRMFGKLVQQPRLIAWHGDAGSDYAYAGLRLAPQPWTDLLLAIKQPVEACTGARFNSLLLNLYRDHSDSMGLHSDDEKELGRDPVIASVSFGATRIFRMKHRFKPEIPVQKIPLACGSVLLMKGKTQHFWKHGINKQSAPCGPRINLTFRMILAR